MEENPEICFIQMQAMATDHLEGPLNLSFKSQNGPPGISARRSPVYAGDFLVRSTSDT